MMDGRAHWRKGNCSRVGTVRLLLSQDPGCALPPQAAVTFLGTLCGLESPVAEGCGMGGEIGEPRRLERCRGPRGTGRDWCGTSASVPHPAALRRSWLAEISAGSLFFVPSSRGLLLSHMLLLKLLCYPLLPSLLPPPSSLQCTHLTPLQTHGPIVSSAPFLALWFPDEAS